MLPFGLDDNSTVDKVDEDDAVLWDVMLRQDLDGLDGRTARRCMDAVSSYVQRPNGTIDPPSMGSSRST